MGSRRRPLTLHDHLSRLNYHQACKLLGDRGPKLILDGGQREICVPEQVQFSENRFQLSLPDSTVTIQLADDARRRLRWRCSRCETPCDCVGSAFALILEEKSLLGLAEPPPDDDVPLENLSEEKLVERAVEERRERAGVEKMTIRPVDPDKPWTEYSITNRLTGKSYRISLRGELAGQYYCSCPDFRTNTLGVCKHIFAALKYVQRKFTARQRSRRFERRDVEVYLLYDRDITLRVGLPSQSTEVVDRWLGKLADRAIDDVPDLMRRIRGLEHDDVPVTIFPDAEEYIQQRLFQQRMTNRVAEIRRDPARHPLRKDLLKTELLPYQLDGIAFAAGAGRAILADDMGLGKTIQGVGVAEMLAREADIKKVLVVCPTSLKSQWRSEIQRFSDRHCQIVAGSNAERPHQYDNDSFFTICNYEQVMRDLVAIERVPWDLIILDEAQRIKNWQAKTSNIIKGLKSRFALALSGTPLENRLEELFSVVQFIDDRRLGPAFRFLHRHRLVDDGGRVLGYTNLAQLRETLKPVMLRRTRENVKQQLPPRTTEMVRIAPTEQQLRLHDSYLQVVKQIAAKAFLTEMDLLRLQKMLLACRMVANSTFLVDKTTHFSTKLERLTELLEQLFDEPDSKTLMFSEWTTMLDLIEPVIKKHKVEFVRLDGSIPQKKRQALVHRFQNDASCRLFMTTNAGSTGLNLQAANTVINVDLPWNPAVLEQRIARAHRMGQQRPVHVYVLVSEHTIEEKLLQTLAAKKDLAIAALDVDSKVNMVEMDSGIENLKRRLEVLLGQPPDAPVNERQKQEVAEESSQFAERRERVAAAGGELLGAAFQFLGELVAAQTDQQPSQETTAALRSRLGECVQLDREGRPQLTVTLPDAGALDRLAQSLARLLAADKAN